MNEILSSILVQGLSIHLHIYILTSSFIHSRLTLDASTLYVHSHGYQFLTGLLSNVTYINPIFSGANFRDCQDVLHPLSVVLGFMLLRFLCAYDSGATGCGLLVAFLQKC